MTYATFTTNSSNMDDIACLESFDSLEHCEWLKLCKRFSASFSIVGCIFTIFIIWLFKKYTEFSQRMIIHLSIATLLQAIFYVLVDIVLEATVMCKMQGALLQFIAWVILLWILSIIFNLLWNVIWMKNLEKYERRISLLCWGLPIVIAGVPFADNAYAPAGAWCWYKNSFAWMFGSWYVWSQSSFVFIFVSIVVITYKLRKVSKDLVGTIDDDFTRRKQSIKEAVRTLRLYPIAYFLVILFPTIHRIQNVVEGSPEHHRGKFILVLLHSLTDPLDGAIITLVFVMDKRTRQVLNLKFMREAWKKKFEPGATIHELKLKSRLSRSDLIIARMSFSFEVTAEPDTQTDRNTSKRPSTCDNTMTTIQEIENSIEVIVRTKKEGVTDIVKKIQSQSKSLNESECSG